MIDPPMRREHETMNTELNQAYLGAALKSVKISASFGMSPTSTLNGDGVASPGAYRARAVPNDRFLRSK